MMMRLTDISAGLAEKLQIARQATGLSTRDVVSRLGDQWKITHPTIANYEKGKTQPTLELLAALAKVYGRTTEWFLGPTATLANIRYRHYKSKVSVAEKKRFEAEALRWLEAYVRLESRLSSGLAIEIQRPVRAAKESPAQFAAKVRTRLGIDANIPIASVVTQMERFGIRVIEVKGPEGIDGFAARLDDTPVVVLNPIYSNDRMRLNESHEFFHDLLGHCGEAGPGGDSDHEDDAFACGRSFLLPRAQLDEAFKGESFVRLLSYKETFGISLSAMVYSAEQEGILSPSKAKRLWIEFARRGWRTKEPGNVRADRATRFEQLLDGAINQGAIDWREAAIVTGIPSEHLEGRVREATSIFAEQVVGQDIPKGGEPTLKGLRLAK